MRLLFVGLILLTITSCKPEGQEVTPATLTGTWIEATARRDTLTFNLSSQGQPVPGLVLVNRGKERNSAGFLVPRLGSGLYSYRVEGKSIEVLSLYSSSTQTTWRGFGDELRNCLACTRAAHKPPVMSANYRAGSCG